MGGMPQACQHRQWDEIAVGVPDGGKLQRFDLWFVLDAHGWLRGRRGALQLRLRELSHHLKQLIPFSEGCPPALQKATSLPARSGTRVPNLGRWGRLCQSKRSPEGFARAR